MRRFATRLLAAMPSTAATPDQVRIVRTSSDEAAAVLSFARVAGALVTLFWHGLSGPVVDRLRSLLDLIDYGGAREFDKTITSMVEKRNWPDPIRPTAYATPLTQESALKTAWGPVVGYFPVLVMAMLDDPNAWTRWFGAACAVAYGAPAILALLFSVLSVPFGIALAIGLLPCGWTLPLAGPYLDIAAEPAPPGTWKVTQLGPENTGDALSHGKAHDDPNVFSEVSKWILDRAAVVDKGCVA